ncbi:hypothetical protein DXT88_19165 [Herbaspirillum lusitanum]|uniref:hypothetical protein n=1 Tax=Herbaspirillum lusitanum TaxID=213312 RepID=UPI002236F163|nr:hypothetical protein [Herbaspirillum lusitanum]MCW5300296.1 hypothetical protein [Herbaspirillum lusitanum]
MSINVAVFFGKETADLDTRFIRAYADLGFEVQLHPELTLTESSASGCIYLLVTKTPPHFLRLAPDLPLLIMFGYGVHKRQKKETRSRQWPPRGVGGYSYEASSRSSAGRSDAAGAMQIVSMAILAKETEGHFYVDGDDTARTGDLAVQQAVLELARFDRVYFDADVHPFESWPPVNGSSTFRWPPIIEPPKSPIPTVQKRRTLFRYKFSWLHVPGIVLITYFLIVTLLYS